MEYNVGAHNDVQLGDKLVEHRLDCTILLDTRKSAIQLKYLKERIIDAIGPHYVYFQTERGGPQSNGTGNNTETIRLPRYKVVATRGALSYIDAEVGDIPSGSSRRIGARTVNVVRDRRGGDNADVKGIRLVDDASALTETLYWRETSIRMSTKRTNTTYVHSRGNGV
jgi:hypothetical protein